MGANSKKWKRTELRCRKPVYKLPLDNIRLQTSGFQQEVNLPSRGHLTMPGDILVVTAGGR